MSSHRHITRMPNWLKTMLITSIVLGLFYGLLQLMGYFIDIVVLMSATLLLTYFLMPPVDFVTRQLSRFFPKLFNGKIPINPRGLGILMVYLTFGLLMTLTAIKTIPPLSIQIRDFAQAFPQYSQQVQARLLSIQPFGKWYYKISNQRRDEVAPLIGPPVPSQENPLQTVSSTVQKLSVGDELSGSGFKLALRYGGKTLTFLVLGLTSLVLVFYLLLDGQSLKRGFVSLLPPRLQGAAVHYLDDIHEVFSTFVNTQIVLSLLVWLLLYIVYSLLGVPYAVFLSVVFALFSIVPVIGPWVGVLPTVLVVALSSEPVLIIPVVAFLSAIYLLKTYWLLPKVFKNRLEIHPVVMIVSLIASIKLAQLAGVLIAFPLASLVCGTYQYLSERKAAKGQYQ